MTLIVNGYTLLSVSPGAASFAICFWLAVWVVVSHYRGRQ